MKKLSGDDVIAIAHDPIEIHKDDPQTTITNSPCNNLGVSETKSNSGKSLFDNNFSKLKALSNANLKSPLSPTMEHATSSNDSIQSTVL